MRKLLVFFLVLLLCLPVTAFAAEGQLVVDGADLLTDSQEAKLTTQLQDISQRRGIDIVVLTADSLEGKSAMAYADDYYDLHGYGYDGVLLLVSMAQREWWISTSGSCVRDLDDGTLDEISEAFLPELSGGDYYAAFSAFAHSCDLAYEYPDEAADHRTSKGRLGGSLVVGAVLALIVVGFMAWGMRSVRPQGGAASYVRGESLNITQKSDRFLFRNVSRTARPQNNGSGGSHRSSSGRSHGGRGGRF